MNRRRAGAVVLAATVVAALVVPVVAGAGVAGSAGMPARRPLASGECVVQVAHAVYPVGCTTRHTAEVAAAGAPAAGASPFSAACTALAEQYVGEPSGRTLSADDTGWTSAQFAFVGVLTAQSTAPDAARVCLVRPVIPGSVPGYTGSVAGAGRAASPPGPLRSCFADPGPAFPAPCGQPHHGEVLANREVAVTTSADPDPDAVARAYAGGCPGLAAARMGVADATFGGRLGVALSAVTIGQMNAGAGGAAPVPADGPQTYVFRLTCAVVTVGAHALTGSVAGLGGAALPLT